MAGYTFSFTVTNAHEMIAVTVTRIMARGGASMSRQPDDDGLWIVWLIIAGAVALALLEIASWFV